MATYDFTHSAAGIYAAQMEAPLSKPAAKAKPKEMPRIELKGGCVLYVVPSSMWRYRLRKKHSKLS